MTVAEALRAEVKTNAEAVLAEILAGAEDARRLDKTPGGQSGRPAVEGHPWPAAAEGGRHGAIVSAAGWCAAKGLSLHQALVLIHDWNRSNQPPESDGELAQQVADCYARYARPEAAPAGRYRSMMAARSRHIEPREWLIPGFLPAGQRVCVVAHPGGGKTFVAIDAAHAIAHGTLFLGSMPPAVRGNVVILDGEGGEPRMVKRYNKLRLALGLPPDPDPEGSPDIFWRSAADIRLSDPASIERLRLELIEIKPKLVVFDTLAKVLGLSDENSNGLAAAAVTPVLGGLTQGLGTTVLLVAHPAKGEGGGVSVRGAGELTADLDVVWGITKTKRNEARQMRCAKDRDGDLEDDRIDFKIEDHDGGTRLARVEVADDSEREDPMASNATAFAIEYLRREGPMGGEALVAAMSKDSGCGRSKGYQFLKAMSEGGDIVYANRLYSLVEQPDET